VPVRKVLHQAVKEGKVQMVPGQSIIDAAVESGLVQPGEAQRLREAEQTCRAVIDVDAFDKEQLLPAEGKVR